MRLAKATIWCGGVLALLGTNIPDRILYWLGIGAYLDYGIDYFIITFGLCVLTGGVVAFGYQREKVSN